MNDGVLGVHLLSTSILSAYDDTDIYLFFDHDKPVYQDLIDDLTDDIPTEISEQARAKQLVEITNAAGEPTPCDSAEACADDHSEARGALAGAVFLSGELGKIAKNLLVVLLRNPSEWVCEGTCKMLLRAQRVNVYPDSVELVFREGGVYPISRETAVELASKLSLDNPNAMCDASSHGSKLIQSFQRKTKNRVYD